MGQHWYREDGTTCHELIGKNGKLRATNVRDARQLKLYPSYSTIVQAVLAKPGLDVWKQKQLLDAVKARPFDIFTDMDDWQKKVLHEAASKSRKAAERGTEIHDKLEQAVLQGIASFEDDVDRPFIEPVYNFVMETFKLKMGTEIIPERSFTHPLGYAGTADLHCPDDDGWVLDFKTKDFKEGGKVAVYGEHEMQLASYREGLEIPRAKCYNLFISVSVPGLFTLIEHKEEALVKAFSKFKSLLEYWQVDHNYNPNYFDKEG